jgi:hypothetical protein
MSLLDQQITEPAGRLDRPGALLEARSPRQQLIDLATRRSHLHFGEPRLVTADGHCGMRPLVRVDAR